MDNLNLGPISIGPFDTSQMNAFFTEWEAKEKAHSERIAGIRKQGSARHVAIQSDEDKQVINAHEEAQKLIAAATLRRTDLETKYESLKVRDIEKLQDKFRKENESRNQAMRDADTKHLDKSVKQNIALLKWQADEEIKTLQHLKEKKLDAEGKGIMSIGMSLLNGGGGGESSGIGGKLLGGLAGAGILGLGGSAIAGMKELGSATLEAEERTENMRVALRATGTEASNLESKTNALRASTIRLADSYAVNAHQLEAATDRYLEFGGSQDKLAAKQKIIIALAQKTGVGLEEAAKYLVKGTSPELLMSLRRFGIALDENADSEQRFNQLSAQSEKLMEGLAEKSLTMAGKMNKARNDWEAFKDSIGNGTVALVSKVGEAEQSVASFFDHLLGLESEEELKLDQLEKHGKKFTDQELQNQKDLIKKLNDHQRALEGDTQAAIDNMIANMPLDQQAIAKQLAKQDKAANINKTPEEKKAALDKELTDLQTDLENKRAVAVQAQRDGDAIAQKSAENEVKIAGDKLNKLQAIFDRENKIGGQDSGGKTPKTPEQKAQEEFEKQKAINHVILQQQINDAYQRFFAFQLTEDGWKKAKLKNEEAERFANIAAVKKYYIELGHIEGTDALYQAIADDKDYQAIMQADNEARDTIRQTDILNQAKANATRKKRQDETAAWEVQKFNEDTNLLKLQLQLISDKKTKSLAVLFDEFAMRREIEQREYESTIKNYTTVEEAWKAHLLRLEIISKEEAAAKDSIESKADDMAEMMKSAAQKSASAFENEFWKPMDAKAKTFGDKLLLDITKSFVSRGLNKLIDDIFDPKKKDDKTVSKYDHALIHAENVVLQAGSLSGTSVTDGGKLVSGGGNYPGTFGNPSIIGTSGIKAGQNFLSEHGIGGGDTNYADPGHESGMGSENVKIALYQAAKEEERQKKIKRLALGKSGTAPYSSDESQGEITENKAGVIDTSHENYLSDDYFKKLGGDLKDGFELYSKFNIANSALLHGVESLAEHLTIHYGVAQITDPSNAYAGKDGYPANFPTALKNQKRGDGTGTHDLPEGTITMSNREIKSLTDAKTIGTTIASSLVAEGTKKGGTDAKGLLKSGIGAGLNFIPGIGPVLSTIFSSIPGLAAGGKRPSGPHIVGEEGPEFDDGHGNITPIGKRTTHYADARRYQAEPIRSYGGGGNDNAMHAALQRSNQLAEQTNRHLADIASRTGYDPYSAPIANAQNALERTWGAY